MLGNSMAHVTVTLMTSVVALTSLCLLTCDGFNDPVSHRSRRGGADGWAPVPAGQPALSKHLHPAQTGTLMKARSPRASASSHETVRNAYSVPNTRRSKRYSMPAASSQQDVAKNEEEVEQVVLDDGGGEGGVRYGVLLDAGSSSTKTKVFTYTPGVFPSLVPHVQLEFSERVKPGLGRFVQHLDELDEYLRKTLSYAVDAIPQRLHASTPVYLKATAGECP